MERKLAAILAADVVGYSALMEADEAGTHQRLKAGREELFMPAIARHHGRVFKLMGDGMLAEFGSVIDAVECAVALQRGLAERNAAIPEAQRIKVRIGINLGEVIVEGDDRYGEGVNIATRLEQLAEPGGICVSGKVAKEVERKLAFGFEPMGERKIKNIAEPVPVFRVRLDGAPGGAPGGRGGAPGSALPRRLRALRSRRALPWAAAVGALVLVVAGAWFALDLRPPAWIAPATPPAMADARPSLVVLPFANLSDDKEQGYLADGITEDLTTVLARIPSLFVISRNSAFAYKDRTVPSSEVANELGVRYILEGSIRRAGDNMRINAQLIDAANGGHLWAERFDGAWDDVFKLQDRVVDNVASALELRLVAGPRMAGSAGGTDDPAAYDLYLRGIEINYATSPGKAAALLRQAVAIDPNFGQAWAELAQVYWSAAGVDEAQAAIGTASYAETIVELEELLKEAEKHPSSNYYRLMADLLVWQRKPNEAVIAAERAIAFDPSDSNAYDQMSLALALAGRASDAQAYLDASRRVDPPPRPYRDLLAGIAAFSLDRFEDAIASLERADPRGFHIDNTAQRLFLLAAAHAHLDHSEALASVKAELDALAKEIDRELTALRAMNILQFTRSGDIERLWTGLSKAGVPAFPFGYEPKDQLTGEEVRSLVFGHELRGQRIDSGEPYVRSTAPDGIGKVSIGSYSSDAASAVEGDFVCTLYDYDIVANCAAIFRNPQGSRETSNEYVWVTDRREFEFSVVK